MSGERAVAQRRLIDNLRAGTHGRQRARGFIGQAAAVGGDVDHLQALRSQLLEVHALVRIPLAGVQLGRFVALGPLSSQRRV
ncbi:MAG TPA: hypothetical protein VIY30_07660, partial [Burkholderiaceae bacterium]